MPNAAPPRSPPSAVRRRTVNPRGRQHGHHVHRWSLRCIRSGTDRTGAGDRAVPAALPSSWVGFGALLAARATVLHGVRTSRLIAAAVALAAAAAGLLLQSRRTTTKEA